MSKTDVIAIFCSDLHLSLTPPPLRSKEPDWFAAMQRPLDELRQLQEKHGCPIFCAGDVFDRWNAPAELINWTIQHLPHMYVIPGQHDLPDHDLSQIERSAYWTLVKANVIHHMENGIMWGDNGGERGSAVLSKAVFVYPFAFGTEISPLKQRPHGFGHTIAIIHQYNWTQRNGYDGAPIQQSVSQHNRPEFEGYDLVVSGDNHIPFIHKWRDCQFVNCGGLMRRKSDDRFDPRVWLLSRDGSIGWHKLDISKDVYLATAKAQEMEKAPSTDLSGLMKRLEELGACALDFVAAMKLDLETNPTRRGVESRITKAMES